MPVFKGNQKTWPTLVFGGGQMILWPPRFLLWGGPRPLGPPPRYAYGTYKNEPNRPEKSLATHWMYLACSLFVGFVGHSICRICSPKNWTKKITNIPVFHQWLRTKHTFFCQYKYNQGRRQIFSKRGGQGKHAIFNGNPCIFLKFLRPGGGKFCSPLANYATN